MGFDEGREIVLLPCGRKVGVVPWNNEALEKGFLVVLAELKTGVLPSNSRLVFGFLELPG